MRIQVKDFMSSPVTMATGENSVQEIRHLMKTQGINAMPVVGKADNSPNAELTIRGIITATDMGNDLDEKAFIGDVMTFSKVHVIHTDSSAQAAAKMMLKHEVHHIVVMDIGRIVGMISSLDFVKLVAEHSLE